MKNIILIVTETVNIKSGKYYWFIKKTNDKSSVFVSSGHNVLHNLISDIWQRSTWKMPPLYSWKCAGFMHNRNYEKRLLRL